MADDSKYILDLISEGEHQKQDFKFEITSTRKIAKTLVAFANSDGGRLLIGVKDNGKVTGIRSEEEFYMIEAAATMNCKPEVTFEYFNRSVEGKTVLEIRIEPSVSKPHFALDESGKWIAYHRINDNNYMADYILLQVWKRKKRERGTFIAYSGLEEKVLSILKEEGPMNLKTLQNQTALNRRKLQNILINLVSVDAVRLEYHENTGIYSILS